MTVKISRRPTSMVNAKTHLLKSGKSAQVNAGPVMPRAGPQLPIADTDEPTAVGKSSPCRTNTIMQQRAMMKKRKVNPKVRCMNSERRFRPSSITVFR